ncbi:MAG: portal protein [Bacteroidales bacterium]
MSYQGDVKLSDEKLQQLSEQVRRYHHHAIGYQQGEVGVKARESWEYYYGRLPEPVSVGSSKWIDSTVRDSVNGVLQELSSVFTLGEDAVRFSPMHSRDANAARAATKLVNQILLRDNPGYTVLHDFFKEALVVRNSFLKRYWHKTKKVHNEEIEDMTKEEFDLYMSQVLENGTLLTGDFEEVFDDEDQPTGKFFGSFSYEVEEEGVKVEHVPLEFIMIDPSARSIDDANYIGERTRKTKEELVEMGFDSEMVYGLFPASSDVEAGVIANARINNLSPVNVSDIISVGDDRSDKVWLHEHYLKTSVADGYVEILQVFTVHNEVMEVNRVDKFPYITATPFPIPGFIWGESITDLTRDIQDLKTVLIRGYIDNIQNANFRRYIAVKGMYDRQSLLNNRPGGVIEANDISAVQPFPHHQLPQGVESLLGYVDNMKEERTGVSRMSQGLDPAVFKNDNAFATVNLMLTQAMNKMRMICRNFAHRALIPLMADIYELVRQNGKQPLEVETPQGWITIDPRMLPERNRLIVATAIGDSERKERAQNLQTAMMMLTQVPQMQQFLQPQNAYFAAAQFMESMGIYDVENFLTPLDQIPPPEPNPAEELQLQMLQEQLKGLQTQTQKILADVQNERMKLDFEQMKTADEIDIKRTENQTKTTKVVNETDLELRKIEALEREVAVAEAKLELERERMLIEAQIEMRQGRAVGIGR